MLVDFRSENGDGGGALHYTSFRKIAFPNRSLGCTWPESSPRWRKSSFFVI